MKKLKLNLETLKVESFETANLEKRKGTIIGGQKATPTGMEGVEVPCDWTALGMCYCTDGGQSGCPDTIG